MNITGKFCTLAFFGLTPSAYRNSEIAETVLLFPFRPSGLPATLLQVKASAQRFTSFT
jgi:hypothetical protein